MKDLYGLRLNSYDHIIKNNYLNLLFNFMFHSFIASTLTISSFTV